jgi:ribonucleoside-diphosphate reductase alpha chain
MTRRKLPDERRSITHRFSVDKTKGYFTVGLYSDGTPGEVFIRVAKQGSTLSGVMNAFAIMVSLALQYGIPLTDLIRKFRGMAFEPSGVTGSKDIQFAASIIDYLFRWMELEFTSTKETAA